MLAMSHALRGLSLIALFAASGCASLSPKKCEFKSVGKPDGVDRDDVACVMDANVTPQARICYEDIILKSNPEMHFRIVSKFQIDTNGKASAIAFEPDIEKSAFADCMRKAIAKAQFPTHTAPSPVKITYPWVFRRTGQN